MSGLFNRAWWKQAGWLTLATTAVVLAGTLATTGLAAPSSLTVVYVSHTESSDIYVLQLNRQTGDLTLLEKVAIPGVVKAGMSTPLAISPDRRRLFVATRGEPQMVATFTIDAKTGKLSYVGNGPLVDSMPFISTDRSGRFLFAASYPGHKLSVSAINAQGLVQPPQQVLTNHTNAHSLLADAQNRFVLALTLGNELVNVFKFDAQTGQLTPHTPPAVTVQAASGYAKAGPRHFVFHPNGKLVYLLGELDGAIHVFDYDARQGQLKEKQSLSALPPGVTGRIAAADIHLTPNGKFLYSSDRTSNTLASFKVNPADGSLTLIEILPTETQPRSFAIDSTGRYLFIGGQRSHRVASYAIHPQTGKLTKLKEYPLGQNPTWIEIVDLPGK